MNSRELFSNILKKRSFLCVGLDSDLTKLPECLAGHPDRQFEFNRRIIDATAPYTVCYKPNLAFYEVAGKEGWESFVKTCMYIRDNYPDIMIIADAKRGDIGNTSKQYADAFFAGDLVDAVTISPYMGRDTVEPFLGYPSKWAVILALTSNPSADDFEMQRLDNGRRVFEEVLHTSSSWGTTDNTMYVVGATKAFMLKSIRELIPDHFLLIPGVGAQGGSLADVAAYGMNRQCGLLVNSSRAIIFDDRSENFDRSAGERTREIRDEMDTLLERFL